MEGTAHMIIYAFGKAALQWWQRGAFFRTGKGWSLMMPSFTMATEHYVV